MQRADDFDLLRSLELQPGSLRPPQAWQLDDEFGAGWIMERDGFDGAVMAGYDHARNEQAQAKIAGVPLTTLAADDQLGCHAALVSLR